MSKFTEFDARKLHKLYKMAHKKRSQEEEVRCEVPFLWVLSLTLVALAHTWARLLHMEVGGPQNGGSLAQGLADWATAHVIGVVVEEQLSYNSLSPLAGAEKEGGHGQHAQHEEAVPPGAFGLQP